MRLASPVETGRQRSVNWYLLPQERSVITVRMHPATLAGPLILAVGWPAGGQETDQPLSAPGHRLGSVPASPAPLPVSGGQPGRKRTSP